MFVVFAVIQFFVQMGSPILWAMMADTVDYGEFKTHRRITGLAFSGALFSLKLGIALGGAAFGWLLGYFGYQDVSETQTTQTLSAIKGIAMLFTVIPAGFHVLVIAVVKRYTLTEIRCDAIRQELDLGERRQASSKFLQ